MFDAKTVQKSDVEEVVKCVLDNLPLKAVEVVVAPVSVADKVDADCCIPPN